ncbi:FUSC family protein [Stenoxybacter acetivorans]|uniref:FUSC family protein n=1 Tax=Stenoxybacter acetivorans TaxID=422441 RepID=UPI00069098FF|nr:FUSC family protein [Stenoxybacter acetivorans]
MQSWWVLLQQQWHDFWQINVSERRWELPFAAALASGLPLFIGAYFGHLEYGLVSSLGGMTFLYLPQTALAHRMVFILCAAMCMSVSFLFGLAVSHFPAVMVLMITLLTIVLTMLCRYVQVPPPGTVFFLMAAMIGAYMPVDIIDIPYQVGLLFMGALLACVVGFFYSLYLGWRDVPAKAIPAAEADMRLVLVDSLIIGVFVGASLLLAQLWQMERPYWVPVSCAAVIQGINFRAVWRKQLHRIIGTAAGMVLAWLLLSQSWNIWALCAVMMLLNMLIETLVVRHYALAVVFITPLTIFLAEAAGDFSAVNNIIQARLWDTVLGSVMGALGGYCLHKLSLRDWLAQRLSSLWPLRNFKSETLRSVK